MSQICTWYDRFASAAIMTALLQKRMLTYLLIEKEDELHKKNTWYTNPQAKNFPFYFSAKEVAHFLYNWILASQMQEKQKH